LALTPAASSFYAGVPYSLNITGGRKPYLVTSSEQTLIALNFTTESPTVEFVANNPGVVDPGLDPNEVPRRSVTITVRDSLGISVSATYSVLQNFFTGYGASYSNTCASTGAVPPQACSGTDTVLSYAPVSQGVLYGNRELQFERVRGDYSFVVEDPSVVPQSVNLIRVRTDQTGRALVRMRVAVNASTQTATYKVTDVSTGVTANGVFTIVQQAPVDAITVLPSNEVTFTGLLSTQCGAGGADVYVYGGTPPYSVVATNPLAVSTPTLAASGDKLNIGLSFVPPPCPQGLAVIVSDSKGARAQIAVKSEAGTGTLPPLTISPTAIPTLLCGQSAQVLVIGGSGSLNYVSTHPRIDVTVSGSTIALTRRTADGATLYPTTGTISVTDGNTFASIGVGSTPANCP
jgi:hypothetical protein